jgi:hypothetical protein
MASPRKDQKIISNWQRQLKVETLMCGSLYMPRPSPARSWKRQGFDGTGRPKTARRVVQKNLDRTVNGTAEIIAYVR